VLFTNVAYNATPTPIKHIWFLPSQKEAIATKPKELDLMPTHIEDTKKMKQIIKPKN